MRAAPSLPPRMAPARWQCVEFRGHLADLEMVPGFVVSAVDREV